MGDATYRITSCLFWSTDRCFAQRRRYYIVYLFNLSSGIVSLMCSDEMVVLAPSHRTTRANVFSMRNGTFRVEYKPTEVGKNILSHA